jgi:hypothetical protein
MAGSHRWADVMLAAQQVGERQDRTLLIFGYESSAVAWSDVKSQSPTGFFDAGY